MERSSISEFVGSYGGDEYAANFELENEEDEDEDEEEIVTAVIEEEEEYVEGDENGGEV